MDNTAFMRATSSRQAVCVMGANMEWSGSRLVGKLLPVARAPIPLSIMLGLTVLTSPPFGIILCAHAQSPDPIVTSDSPEYCGELMSRFTGMSKAAAMPPPTEAAQLLEEGERMCGQGQTRGGIQRLRRALLILRRGED
jgi:hypothetical protein